MVSISVKKSLLSLPEAVSGNWEWEQIEGEGEVKVEEGMGGNKEIYICNHISIETNPLAISN